MRGLAVAAGTDGAPCALRTILPLPPILLREVESLAYIVPPASIHDADDFVPNDLPKTVS
ncbi:MAG: hypothetical protein ABI318_23250 [Chthoniobacteraceae bacterium]